MPDRPTDNPGPPSGGDPEKTLHDLLAALSNVGDDASGDAPGRSQSPGLAGGTPSAGGTRPGGGLHGTGASGDASESSPVQELRTALDRLFDLVRAERAEHRAEIAELEAALATAHARIRQLEAGESLEVPAPPPNDFNQLREAAERLRQRTQELFRDAGAVPAAPEARDASEASTGEPGTTADATADASDVAVAGSGAGVDESPADDTSDGQDHEPTAEIASIEAFTKPTVLRVFPGPAGPEDDLDLEVESELAIEEDILHPPVDEMEHEAPVAVVAEVPLAHDLPVEDELPDEPTARDDEGPSESSDLTTGTAGTTADAHPSQPDPAATDGDAGSSDGRTPAEGSNRPEPIEIAPRPARKRRAGLRRRRIDARKLEGVDPATALRAMVTSIDDIWTANVTLDLAIALTDGGTLKVTGGHNRPLAVNWVEPGTPARTTVTSTTAQLVPLFGRLDLSDEQSAPLIHGPRRDADLLVGWIDRAQRLSPEPL